MLNAFHKFDAPYDRPQDAYNHLLKYDLNPFVEKEPGNYPVMLTIRMSVKWVVYRPFTNFEAISRFFPNVNIYRDHVVVNLEHFREKYREGQAVALYRLITTSYRFPKGRPVVVGQDAHKMCWDIFQAKKVTTMKAKTSRSNGRQFLFDLKAMRETTVKFPKQCMQIISWLIQDQRSAYDMKELEKFAIRLPSRGLVTRQEPFRVLQFYLPQLHAAALLQYDRRADNASTEDGDGDYD